MSNLVILALKFITAIVIIGVVVYFVRVIRDIVKKKPDKKDIAGIVISNIKSIIISIVLIAVCVFALNSVSEGTSKTITYVKDAYPTEYQISYGQALDNYLSDVEWSYFRAEGTYALVVEVNGSCIYSDESVDMELQFIFDSVQSPEDVTDESEFSLRYVGIDGQGCTNEEANDFLNAAFSSYAESNGLPYDYCYFFES